MVTFDIDKYPSDIEGLAYIPSLKNWDNSLALIPVYFDPMADRIEPINYFSYKNREVLFESMKMLALHHDVDKTILEIGIGNRNRFLNTSTFILTCFKHPNVKYMGVDRRNRGWLFAMAKNIYLYKSRTDKLLPIFTEEIDLLLIDGGHSVKTILVDWQFSSLVRDDGIILIHDIKVHPGPNVLIDAIDTDIYTVDRYFLEDEDDFGIAVVYKKEEEYGRIRSRVYNKSYGES